MAEGRRNLRLAFIKGVRKMWSRARRIAKSQHGAYALAPGLGRHPPPLFLYKSPAPADPNHGPRSSTKSSVPFY